MPKCLHTGRRGADPRLACHGLPDVLAPPPEARDLPEGPRKEMFGTFGALCPCVCASASSPERAFETSVPDQTLW